MKLKKLSIIFILPTLLNACLEATNVSSDMKLKNMQEESDLGTSITDQDITEIDLNNLSVDVGMMDMSLDHTLDDVEVTDLELDHAVEDLAIHDMETQSDFAIDCLPETEICDGLDNDCDGITDNVMHLGEICYAGNGECMASGTQVCHLQTGELRCNALPLPPMNEVCADDLDNNCDGIIDNPELCQEDCLVLGDEDGNGLADCADPACVDLNPECCIQNSSRVCFENHIHWIDSCGNLGERETSCNQNELCVELELPACEIQQDLISPCSQTNNCPNLNWVQIEAGNFLMGSSLNESTQPIHSVTVNSFEMLQSEITVAQYRACVDAQVCSPPQTRDPACTWSETIGTLENYPINCVSWHQIMVFAAWIEARLPTEAEWEYAAKGQGQSILYPWGNTMPNCTLLNYADCESRTTEVCLYPSGNTEQGLCDMSGNVFEWVQDSYHRNYEGAPQDQSGWCSDTCPQNANHPNYDPEDSTIRMIRGGSWDLSNVIQTAERSYDNPTATDDQIGARLVR